MIQHVLVAVDGSEGARRAAEFAKELAQAVGARVSFLHVLEPVPVVNVGFAEFYGVTHRQPTGEEMAKLREAIERIAEGFPKERSQVLVEYGNPAETICSQAEALGADLVVVGARGLGAVGRFLVGSVSDRVVRQCGRNVTVVH